MTSVDTANLPYRYLSQKARAALLEGDKFGFQFEESMEALHISVPKRLLAAFSSVSHIENTKSDVILLPSYISTTALWRVICWMVDSCRCKEVSGIELSASLADNIRILQVVEYFDIAEPRRVLTRHAYLAMKFELNRKTLEAVCILPREHRLVRHLVNRIRYTAEPRLEKRAVRFVKEHPYFSYGPLGCLAFSPEKKDKKKKKKLSEQDTIWFEKRMERHMELARRQASRLTREKARKNQRWFKFTETHDSSAFDEHVLCPGE